MKTIKKLFEKLSELNASENSVALGFACGAAISMTPFIGFHTLLAASTAFLIKASVLASLVGTIVGNPWTFAFIWPASYELGRLILGQQKRNNLDFDTVFDNFKNAFGSHDFSGISQDLEEVIYPMAVGGVILYVITFALSFVIIKHILKKLKNK